MLKLQRFVYYILVIIGLGLTCAFATWWFNVSHIASNFHGPWHVLDFALFMLLSYVIWHQIAMQVLLWAISSHIKPYRPASPMPELKVAFITNFVPNSESVDLLKKTLPAMVRVQYQHDTWLLDEGQDAEARRLCGIYGVKYFSRAELPQFNTEGGKFASKTKGGNHNSWYATVGAAYDVVAQIDTDFEPDPQFLNKTLGYFRDPRVAFVGTPQIYGNTKESFIARGAAEQTYSFYGPILRGLFGMDMTLLIGANHVIRVAALKDINYYRAHITEDLLTGMELHSRHWKSVYVPEALAIGEGPDTWSSYFSQQMRWAYGCIDILFRHSPKLLARMRRRHAIYYFLLQQHYFSGVAQLTGAVLLTTYFAFGITPTHMELQPLLKLYVPLLVWQGLVNLWLQRFNIRPKEESGILLAGKVISFAAWPVYFLAGACAVIKKRLRYKVTPKGGVGAAQDPIKILAPHMLLATMFALDLVIGYFGHHASPIMLFWAVTGLIMLSTLVLATALSTAIKKARMRARGTAPAYPPTSSSPFPQAPTNEQKYLYVVRNNNILVIGSLISFTTLTYSMVRFYADSPLLYPLYLLLAFTVVYFIVSLRVNFFSKDFDIDKHRQLVAKWRPRHYPAVDIFLPTCGEPIGVISNTWDGIAQIRRNYRGHVTVYCLDDADKPEVGALAREYGFRYLVRPNRGEFKKAGNLRYGFEHSNGEYIVIFDADFRPRSDFLDELLPYFSAQPKIGIVQSPQYFNVKKSQAWLERGAGAVQEFFYRTAQVSRQNLGAAICVGSNAVYRREALNTIGGTALVEHSEDVRTGFAIRQHGWTLQYVPVILATGLCPAELEQFFRQQYRWATGALSMVTGNDFWSAKLSLKNRLCYFSGFLYYLHTAIYAFLTPVIPLILLVFLPSQVRFANFTLIAPALIYSIVVYPLWHRARYGSEAWSTRLAYSWAHWFAIIDLIRRKQLVWHPTGAKSNNSRQYVHFRLCTVFFNFIPGVIWVGAAIWRAHTGDAWNFLLLLGSGLFYVVTVSRIVFYRTTPSTYEAPVRRLQRANPAQFALMDLAPAVTAGPGSKRAVGSS